MFHPKGPSLRELIKQGLSSTKEGYDQLASKFDYTPFLTPKEIIDATSDYLKTEGPFEYAIDLCTGTGAGIEGLLPIVRREIVGIDWSEPMLAEARKKFSAVTKPEVRFVCKNIFDIQFLKDFDLITCFGALGHIEKNQQKEFIDVVYSMLRREGKFAFITAERPKWYHLSAWPYFAFDATMKLRNHWIKPEFVMYYMNFLLPDILNLFDEAKWSSVKVISLEIGGKESGIRLVIAEKK
ncbi:MAG: class I SAM-dependent methyltransferase [bacterium]|nr:class I SAM-dependent methyltransferase [bacterium]